MPEEVEDCVQSVLEDNPDMDESQAYAICNDEKTKFKAELRSGDGMQVLYKEDDGRMLIWGPASVEIVDKENDKITAEALEDALPQLLRRKRLSLEHTDQLVGDIKESHDFDDPVEVQVNGDTLERSEFPTAVLDPEEDDVPEKGLYVAGEVWSDTKQAKEAQEDIENGVIDSYSISGEAIQSSTQVKDNELVDEIKEMDLSAVTLCEEGMNQKAKFAVLSKSDGPAGPDEVGSLAKQAIRHAMTEQKEEEAEGEDEEEEEETPTNPSEAAAMDKSELMDVFKDAAEEVIKEHLPDGDLATKDDIPGEDELREKFEAFSSDGESEEKQYSEAVLELSDEYDMDPEAILERLDDEEEEEDMPPLDEEEDEEVDMPPEDPDDLDEVEEDEIEDPDDDDEEEVEIVEGGPSLDHEALKQELPEDLYATVKEYLTEPEAKEDDDEGGEDYDGEDGEEESGEDEEDEEIGKSATNDLDEYFETVNSPSGLPKDVEKEIEKSFDQNEVEIEPEGEGALDELYKQQGIEI